MQYQRVTDDASLIVTENGESQLFSSSLGTNRNFCRVRKFLLILLLIQLILCIILLMIDAHLLIKGNTSDYRQGMRSLGPLLFSFVYYGYGLIVIYRYHHFGIYLFSWLSLLQYISLCLEVFFNILYIVKHPSYDKQTKIGFRAALMISIITIFQAILTVILFKLSFKLVRLIKIFKRDFLEQM